MKSLFWIKIHEKKLLTFKNTHKIIYKLKNKTIYKLIKISSIKQQLNLGTPAPTLSALIFMLAVFSRQTNIIWAAFYCLKHLEQDFNSKRPFSSTLLCVLQHWAFGLLGLAFIIFFIRNDFSIVLGDSEFIF